MDSSIVPTGHNVYFLTLSSTTVLGNSSKDQLVLGNLSEGHKPVERRRLRTKGGWGQRREGHRPTSEPGPEVDNSYNLHKPDSLHRRTFYVTLLPLSLSSNSLTDTPVQSRNVNLVVLLRSRLHQRVVRSRSHSKSRNEDLRSRGEGSFSYTLRFTGKLFEESRSKRKDFRDGLTCPVCVLPSGS